jgi:hypothetical protein
MQMNPEISTSNRHRLGFHYYPDASHYTDCDLRTWLPELKQLGAKWITLVAPRDRAIPEAFITGLVQAGIEPILHFHFALTSPPPPEEMGLLFSSYARWGVRYAALFDRPNTKAAWNASTWAQTELVERFLDIFIPLAEAALNAGMIPVLPPLEPGGDYWDTSFLLAALRGIQRRGSLQLLQSLALGAYAWVGEHPIEWGAGGPERWPGTRPYVTPPDQQDQRGFYIFDWYKAIAQAVLQKSPDILLLGAGYRMKTWTEHDPSIDEVYQETQVNLALYKLIQDKQAIAGGSDIESPVAAEVLACNFWLLACAPDEPMAEEAWFQADGSVLPIVEALYPRTQASPEQELQEEDIPLPPFDDPVIEEVKHPIEHYLLLPLYDWGVIEWHLDAIRPYILRHQPTIGFNLSEAMLAKHVTVLGGEQTFQVEDIKRLHQAGCTVELVSGDGTSIATQMAVL